VSYEVILTCYYCFERYPGFEPRPRPWKGYMLPLNTNTAKSSFIQRNMKIVLRDSLVKLGKTGVVLLGLEPRTFRLKGGSSRPKARQLELQDQGTNTSKIVVDFTTSKVVNLAVCGADRDRTDDLRLFRPALYAIAPSELLPHVYLWFGTGSNRRRQALQACALPTELPNHYVKELQ
jgi:hypothetical protein